VAPKELELIGAMVIGAMVIGATARESGAGR
jgi:hypothetical protein